MKPKERKDIKSTEILHKDFEAWDDKIGGFDTTTPSSYFIKTAMHYVFFHTKKRKLAQEQADIDYPPAGKYKIQTIMKASVR